MPRSVKHGGKTVYKYRNLKNNARKKNRSLKKKKAGKATAKQLAAAWDNDKSMRANIAAMGLAFDPNAAIPIKRGKKPTPIGESMEVEEVSVDEVKEIRAQQSKGKKKLGALSAKKKEKVTQPTSGEVKASKVVGQLEEQAKEETEQQKVGRGGAKLTERDIEFCVYMFTKHKEDYKAMSRDPRNIWQETPKQIEKKIRIYKQSPLFEAIEGMETE